MAQAGARVRGNDTGPWVLLTGEYPPKIGGVAAYTRLLARALAARGDRVEVWAPPFPGGPPPQDPGVAVHVLPDHLGPRSLALLDRALARRPRGRLLVQFVPHSLGMRAMNVPLCGWLATRGRPFWVMFHELAFPIRAGAPLRHNVLGAVNRMMLTLVARSAETSFVSTTKWHSLLRKVAPAAPAPVWLPVPSNLPEEVDASAVARARAALGISPDRIVVGSFGTYGAGVADLLKAIVPSLLANDDRRVALLLGKGSQEVAAGIPGAATKERVFATGARDAEELAACLACVDVAVQPYPDGVSTRRASSLASLALGVPVVTNAGHGTEALWRSERPVALAPEASAGALIEAAEAVLGSPGRGEELGSAGRDLYRRSFSWDCTLRTLVAHATETTANEDTRGR
jgi:glycosyltransferase involved in cell wall biosynthesis